MAALDPADRAVAEKIRDLLAAKTDKIFAGKKERAAVYDRDELSVGARLRTPCIVTEYSSTTLIPPSANAEVDGYGNLIIQVT